MITNVEARNAVVAQIEAAKITKRRSNGSFFRTDSTNAPWLARGERALGLIGGRRTMAIYSPAGAREKSSIDRVLFYGAEGVLIHEEAADGWFDAQFARS